MKALERPKIKDYFKEGTTLNEVVKIYNSNPELFKYTQAADFYIDHIESERDELKGALSQEVRLTTNLYQELQTLKEAVREWLKAGDDFATNKINEDKYDKIFYKLKELIK